MGGFTSWLKNRGSWRHITRTEEPYLDRYFLAKGRKGRVYLHNFHDSDTNLNTDGSYSVHDHPAWNISIVLAGEYREWYPDGTFKIRKAGDIVFRTAEVAHWIEIPAEQKGKVWSLFIMGETKRQWGFYLKEGWISAEKLGIATRDVDFRLEGWLFPKVVWLTKQTDKVKRLRKKKATRKKIR